MNKTFKSQENPFKSGVAFVIVKCKYSCLNHESNKFCSSTSASLRSRKKSSATQKKASVTATPTQEIRTDDKTERAANGTLIEEEAAAVGSV